MFHELRTLVGHPVSAIDGEIGHIRTFLFDDQSWKVRYLVVDVRHWLPGREVVLPTAVLDQPSWTKKTCRARLTKEHVRESPNVDTEKPVSRQQELAMEQYFGPLAAWMGEQFIPSSFPVGVKYPVNSDEDPHLRSTWHMLGYEVWATNGDLGRLEGFVLDEDQWHLSYVDVKAGIWLHNRSVLIPTQWVDRVLWATHQIFLHRAAGSVATDITVPSKTDAS